MYGENESNGDKFKKMPCLVVGTSSRVPLIKDTVDSRMCATNMGSENPQVPCSCDHPVCLLLIKTSFHLCWDPLPEP